MLSTAKILSMFPYVNEVFWSCAQKEVVYPSVQNKQRLWFYSDQIIVKAEKQNMKSEITVWPVQWAHVVCTGLGVNILQNLVECKIVMGSF